MHPPKRAENGPLPVPSRGPHLPCHPRSSRASWSPARHSCLCADPDGGGGGQASKAEQRAPESARRAPAPRLAAPCFPARRALCSRPGPGPEGAARCQGARRRGRRSTYVSL